MDLAAKSSALLRSKLVMRLSCVLVAVGFLVSSVVTPRARAVAVVDDVAVGAMSCAAFLESIGLPLTATVAEGAASTALVPVGITAVAGEYAAATGAAASGEAFLGTVAAGTAVSTAGTIILTAAAVAAMAGLAYWLVTEYELLPDGDSASVDSFEGYIFLDGTRFNFMGSGHSATHLSVGVVYQVDSDHTFSIRYDGVYRIYVNGKPVGSLSSSLKPSSYCIGGIYGAGELLLDNDIRVYLYSSSGVSLGSVTPDVTFRESGFASLAELNYDISVKATNNYSIPEIQQNQSMEITIPSAAPGSTLAELAETVPQQVADGTLSATYTIDTAAPTPPSISDGDVEDVDELGLPSLGEALTRRFPFSIPWDIARGITLLAAPAKTPYFEVDFYAPISDLVGGWQGSTKLVLDFSQFESLGRLSRWTSTIGFCLFLASATKRFIWTA